MPRQRNNINAYEAEITRWYQQDELSQKQIVDKLQVEHAFQTSERSLQRALRGWGVRKNENRVDEIEAEFRALFEVGLQKKAIILYLQRERPELRLKLRSVERRASQWGLYRYNPEIYTPALLALVQYYFFVEGLKDEEILTQLRCEHKVDISYAFLIRIRVENSMSRKVRNEEERMRLTNALEGFLNNYDQTSDALRDYGRGSAYGLIRRGAEHAFPRKMIWDAMCRRYPEAIQQRRETATFVRREAKFIVPGPNYMWSMDGYQKLRFLGLEIYAAIDAYSRRIIWCSVCRSTSLPANIVQQYLKAILRLGFRPWLTRTDHGVETPLVARAQFDLARVTQPRIEIVRLDGSTRIHEQGHRITDSHIWGASRGNRKIEQWWRQLRSAATGRWIDFGKGLESAGWFSKDNIADQVAFYAIYGDIIKRDVKEHVVQWNNHKIRYQPHKNHVISGHCETLWRNYGETGVENWAVDIANNPQLLNKANQLLEPVRHYDFDSLLSPETQQVCDEWLAEHPLTSIENSRDQPHFDSYMNLKRYLEEYEQQGRQPKLSCNELPRGGLEWYRGELQQLQEFLPDIAEAVRNIERDGDEYGAWLNA